MIRSENSGMNFWKRTYMGQGRIEEIFQRLIRDKLLGSHERAFKRKQRHIKLVNSFYGIRRHLKPFMI